MPLYTTTELLDVVEDIPAAPSAFLDAYFPLVHTSTSESIALDEVSEDADVAAYVHPSITLDAGQLGGHLTRTLTLPHTRELDTVNPNRAVIREAGEAFGPKANRGDWEALQVSAILAKQLRKIQRLKELQAVSAVANGAVVVSGKGYPTQTIDFGRPALVTANPTWTAGTTDLVDIVNFLDDVAEEILDRSDQAVESLWLGKNVWRFLRRALHADSLALTRDSTVSDWAVSMFGPAKTRNAVQVYGQLNGYFLGTNSAKLKIAGTVTPMIGANEIVFVGGSVGGVQAHGAVYAPEEGTAGNGLVAEPYVPRSWVDNNPSGRFLSLESVPLMVPVNTKATAKVTVTLA